MPLDPKQQPPYYQPGTGTSGQAPLTKVYSQTTIVESATTTLTNVTTYIIPANTLQNNGDAIEMTFWGNTYNNPTVAIVKATLFGNANDFSMTGDHTWKLKITILRQSSSVVAYSGHLISSGTTNILLQGTYESIDFTDPNNLQIQIEAGIDGNIRSTAGYITIIK